MLDPGVLGVDIGSVAVSIGLIGTSGVIQRADHRLHKGRVKETLLSLIEESGPVPLWGVAFTSASPPLLSGARIFDSQVSLIAGCRRFFPPARSLLYVGGERFGLIRLNADGTYHGARTNSS